MLHPRRGATLHPSLIVSDEQRVHELAAAHARLANGAVIPRVRPLDPHLYETLLNPVNGAW